ncbi:Stk1 family PASTA domain-containing Ser/Thr kinase [Kitasatospora sp. NPDC127111]|uniref:Stk1 family PASTA domain-containing Ser/Thr kinase n=1 Tax=Kitasatospora sp. NPDC127111 TaxID=3345363 RepID=UPI0036332FA1
MDADKTERLPGEGRPRTVGNGRYVLEAALGEGGMASVHRAHDTVLDRTVAVKTLHVDLARDPAFRERFRREAKAVAGLNHTNIVAVHDFGEETDDADGGGVAQYIVMEYVQGRSLREQVRDRAGADGATALSMTAAVLDALAYSHGRGLIHRDIKPANVMVTADGVVKVMDFGIARALQSDATAMTQTGTVLGTPQYLSPEQALGKPADARSDLYSVGCMLFELVTGTLPFDGESALSVLYQHVQQPPPAPSSVNPALAPAIDAIVARALSKDPAERYQSAEAMADDIRRVAAGESPTRRIPPYVPPTVTAPTSTAPPFTSTAPTSTAPLFTTPGVTMSSPGMNPEQQLALIRRKRRALRVYGAVVAVMILGIAATSVSGVWSRLSHPSSSHTPDPRATGALAGCDPVPFDGKISPPTFRGMSPAEAHSCAEIAGLKLQENTTKGNKSDKDTVVRQEPESQEVKTGSTVTVWISAGGDPRATGDLAACEVQETHGKVYNPRFTGKTAAKARVCAEIAGLKLEEAGTIQDASTPSGQVAKQQPGPTEIQAGSTVKVWISTGGDPRATGKLVTCDAYATSDEPYAPNLTYMAVTDARACAEIAHVKLEEHTVPDELWEKGKVVKQEPEGGTRIDPGSTVKVWVSSGKP